MCVGPVFSAAPTFLGRASIPLWLSARPLFGFDILFIRAHRDQDVPEITAAALSAILICMPSMLRQSRTASHVLRYHAVRDCNLRCKAEVELRSCWDSSINGGCTCRLGAALCGHGGRGDSHVCSGGGLHTVPPGRGVHAQAGQLPGTQRRPPQAAEMEGLPSVPLVPALLRAGASTLSFLQEARVLPSAHDCYAGLLANGEFAHLQGHAAGLMNDEYTMLAATLL